MVAVPVEPFVSVDVTVRVGEVGLLEIPVIALPV